MPDIQPEPYRGSATVSSNPTGATALRSVGRLPMVGHESNQLIFPSHINPLNSINYNTVAIPASVADLRTLGITGQTILPSPMSQASFQQLQMQRPQITGASIYPQSATYGPNDARNIFANRNQMQTLPYALVPTSYTSLFGQFNLKV